ncbi:MAG: tRNA (adenosine(37)-N6)-threonylcarbamoyltransferase complex ATPase subunit type 1 TsaE [Bacteroidota bacterium]
MIEVADVSLLGPAARQLLGEHKGKRVFALYGAMGAGKTTFIKALCRELGVTDDASSPTFALVNEYHTAQGDKIFHFDLYRIKNLAEALDFGADEYLYSGYYCFIEWPEKIEELLPPGTVRLRIDVNDEKRRIAVI